YLISLSDIFMSENQNKNIESEVNNVDESTEVTETEVEETTKKTTEEVEENTSTETEETNEVESEETAKTEQTVDNSEELRKQIQNLSEEVNQLRAKERKQDAENLFNDLLSKGKIVPSVKETFVQLAEASNTEIQLSTETVTLGSLLTKLFSNMPTIVNLSEKGIDVEHNKGTFDLSEETVQRQREIFFTDNPDGTEEEFQAYIERN